MTRRPQTRVTRGVADPLVTRHQAPAPAAPVPSQPERAPTHCPYCGQQQPTEPPRSWRIEFRPGTPLLTSNARDSHWGPGYSITSSIKDVAIGLARQQKIPPLSRVSFAAEFRPPPGRRRVVRDTHNLAPAVKAAIDGITKAGVIRDDSDSYVGSVVFRPGEPHTHPLGQLVLIVTELPEETPQ